MLAALCGLSCWVLLKADTFANGTGEQLIHAHGSHCSCAQTKWAHSKSLLLGCNCLVVKCMTRYLMSALLGCLFAAVRLIKTIRRKNPAVQLLLFSATYNDKVKEFAMRIAPNANQVGPGLAVTHMCFTAKHTLHLSAVTMLVSAACFTLFVCAIHCST